MPWKDLESLMNLRLLQEVAAVDDLKLTITSRMFIYMKWTDERVIHNRTNKDEPAIFVIIFCFIIRDNSLTLY